MRAYRLVKARRSAEAFTGDGAALTSGRWNPKGQRMVYTSESLALALLENLVHLQSIAALSTAHVFLVADVPNAGIVDVATFDPDYRAKAEQLVGAAWLGSLSSVGLRVPSAVLSHEHNILLNPAHPDFASIVISDPEPLPLDGRLKTLVDDPR